MEIHLFLRKPCNGSTVGGGELLEEANGATSSLNTLIYTNKVLHLSIFFVLEINHQVTAKSAKAVLHCKTQHGYYFYLRLTEFYIMVWVEQFPVLGCHSIRQAHSSVTVEHTCRHMARL